MKIGSLDHFVALVSTALLAVKRHGVKGLGSEAEGGTWAEEARRAVDAHENWDRLYAEAGEEVAPAPVLWPKRCACGQVYTRATWDGLRARGFVGAFKSGGKRYACELRDCVKCSSTIGIEVEIPAPKPTSPDDTPAEAVRAQLAAFTMADQATRDALAPTAWCATCLKGPCGLWEHAIPGSALCAKHDHANACGYCNGTGDARRG